MTSCPFNATLLHLDNFSQGTPRAAVASLRDAQRIVWQPDEYAAGGHWLVLDKPDIDAVLRDPATFSSSFGPLLKDFPEELLAMQRQAMTFLDPPEHRTPRSLVDHAFQAHACHVQQAHKDYVIVLLNTALPHQINQRSCQCSALAARLRWRKL